MLEIFGDFGKYTFFVLSLMVNLGFSQFLFYKFETMMVNLMIRILYIGEVFNKEVFVGLLIPP